MNWKRFALATAAVFVLGQILDYLIHGVILMADYQASPQQIWNPKMQEWMPYMSLLGVGYSILFVYIFTRGYEAKGWLEGLRYGVIIALFASVLPAFTQAIIYPVPMSLAVKWAIFGSLEMILFGIVAALIYRRPA